MKEMDIAKLLLMMVISGRTLCYPLDTGGSTDLNREELQKEINGNSTVCHYKGRRHGPGEVVAVDEPCLLCHCNEGALTCNLRICPDVPDPLPANCYIVHKDKECCPQVLCDTEDKVSEIEVRTVNGQISLENNVCLVNGSVYAEGSALKSSESCEYCYCINGQQKCIKPKCSMSFDDCKPLYSSNACCPTGYDCRDVAKSDEFRNEKNSKMMRKNEGCIVDDVTYAEGELIQQTNSTCEMCYCMKGKIRCVPVSCEMNLNGDCEPIYIPGQCCPISYTCSKPLMGISEESMKSLSKGIELTESSDQSSSETQAKGSIHIREIEDASTSGTYKNQPDAAATVNNQEETLKESTMSVYYLEETTKSQTEGVEYLENTTNSRSQQNKIPDPQGETTSDVTTEETTTPTLTSYSTQAIGVSNVPDVAFRNNIDLPAPFGSNSTSPFNQNTTPLPKFAEILINSPQMEDEYDSYDYNEPRLPPSLPNLIIFPFVAADAVVQDKEVTQTSNYDEGSIKRVGSDGPFYNEHFSPPVKTEGGFVPKPLPVLGNPYQMNRYLVKEGGTASLSKPEGLTPSITMRPKANSDQCELTGRIYDHGELIPELVGCQPCICYYGEVLCREVMCPPIRAGCIRSGERDAESCCGRIICGDKEASNVPTQTFNSSDKVTEMPVEIPVTLTSSKGSNPDSIRNVIQTEEAPSFSSFKSSQWSTTMVQHTKKPVTVAYKNIVVDYYPDFLITTTRDEVRKKDYRNPGLYTTEIYPFTNSLSEVPKSPSTIPFAAGNVTLSVQATVTSSRSTPDYERSDGFYSKPTYEAELIKTSSRPVITIATEPTRQLYSTTFNQERKPERATTKRTRDPTSTRFRPTRRTTEAPPSDRYNTPTLKASSSGKYKYSAKNKTKFSTSTTSRGKHEVLTKTTTEKNADHDSFSLDNVLRFFFDTDTTTPHTVQTKSVVSTRKTTKKEGTKKFTSSSTTTRMPELAREEATQVISQSSGNSKYKDFKGRVPSGRPEVEQTSKIHSLAGLLKIAGCNIYGRMYRVGKIIAELSNSCMECICTDIGVECNPLIC